MDEEGCNPVLPKLPVLDGDFMAPEPVLPEQILEIIKSEDPEQETLGKDSIKGTSSPHILKSGPQSPALPETSR